MRHWICFLAGALLLVLLAACGSASTPVRPVAVISISPTVVDVSPTVTSTAVPTRPQPTATPGWVVTPAAAQDEYAFEMNRKLGRGINLGNALEAPQEGEWGVVLQPEYFKTIKAAGFDSVRIPVRWMAHAGDSAPYTIDPVFLARVDWAVQQAVENGLVTVVNIHFFDPPEADPRMQKDRYLAIWTQIAEHFKDAPETVFFELLNEPNGALTQYWNEFAADAIQVVRKSNPDRILVVGSGSWNDIPGLFNLQLPDNDRRIIVTAHYYSPMQFTHQGADWVKGSDAWMGTVWKGNKEDQEAVIRDFNIASNWSRMNSRPIFLGEFGAYSKADMESRVRWTTFVASQADARGWSRAYWEFCAGFGAYDKDAGAWREPLLKALMP